MGLFNFFGKSDNTKPKLQDSIKAQEEMKERLMAKLTENLSAHNFTRMEIKEVFDIIELAEADIQTVKDTLKQIKQSGSDPTAAIAKMKKEVAEIQQQMSEDIKAKVRQIKQRKMMYRKTNV